MCLRACVLACGQAAGQCKMSSSVLHLVVWARVSFIFMKHTSMREMRGEDKTNVKKTKEEDWGGRDCG